MPIPTVRLHLDELFSIIKDGPDADENPDLVGRNVTITVTPQLSDRALVPVEGDPHGYWPETLKWKVGPEEDADMDWPFTALVPNLADPAMLTDADRYTIVVATVDAPKHTTNRQVSSGVVLAPEDTDTTIDLMPLLPIAAATPTSPVVRGEPGPVPVITADATTLAPGSEATAVVTGPPEAPLLTLGIPRGEPGTGGGGGGAVDSVNGKTGAVVLDAEDVGARPDTWAPDLTGLVEDDDPRLTDARTPLAHNHPVGDVTGLQDALDAKQAAGNYAAATHDHDARYVRTVNGNGPDGDGNVVVATDVGSVTWGSIEEKPSEFPPASHSHALGDVTGLTGALSGKVDGTDSRLSDARTPTAHDHPIADVTGLQNALDGKQAAGNYAAAVHDHDGRYYTQTQVDTALTGKVGTSDPRLTDAREPTAHSHAISDVTGLSDALDGKQAAGSYAAATHEHDADDLAGVVKTINGTPPDEDGNATISTGTAVAVLPPGRLPRPDITWIDTAQPGHGWTRPEPYGSLTDDTSVKVMGTQSIRVFSTAARISLPAIDMRHRDFVVLMRMGEMTGDTWVFLQISDSPSMSPLQGRLIGMGGSSWWREGEWLLVTVPGTATGTQLDMSAIRSAQIATYSDGEVWVQAIGTVPKTKSVITISFDDGYSSVIEAARQSMSPRGMVGTSYIIPDLIDSGANFMTLDDLHELKDMHGWDIQSHALPLAIDRDPEELRDELRDIRQWITDNGLGTGEHFAWAGGQFDPSAISVAKEVFTSARSIHDKMETMPPGEPHRLRGWTGIGGSLTVAQVSGIIDWCAAEGGWLHLVFHRITDSPIAPENCTWADFNAILDLITASGIPVRTVSDVLSGPPPPTVIPQAEYEELDPPPYVEYNVVMES